MLSKKQESDLGAGRGDDDRAKQSSHTDTAVTQLTHRSGDKDGACGWFIGTVVSSVVGKAWKKTVPTATHLIEYKERETKTKKLVGKAASELSSEKYGPEEWWLLLEPVA